MHQAVLCSGEKLPSVKLNWLKLNEKCILSHGTNVDSISR